MKSRIHPWALGISLVVIAFPVAIIAVAVLVSNIDLNLVSRDYNEKDSAFQDKMDARRRAEALAEKPVVAYDPSTRSCVLRLGALPAWRNIRGTVRFYRISDSRMDIQKDLSLDRDGSQVFPLQTLQAGQWIVQLSWESGGEKYYLEERIFR